MKQHSEILEKYGRLVKRDETKTINIPNFCGIVVSKKHGMMPAAKYRLFLAVIQVERENGHHVKNDYDP